MKKNKKKGFTIVELVIVIAVIAILAAVLIPTFSNIIKKANTSADIQAMTNMNKYLAVEDAYKGTLNISDVFDVLKSQGLDAENYKPIVDGTYYFYDQNDNRIVYTNASKEILFGDNIGKTYEELDHQWYSLIGYLDTTKATWVEPTAYTQTATYQVSSAEDLVKIAEYTSKNISNVNSKITIKFTTPKIDLMGADVTFTNAATSNIDVVYEGAPGGTTITGLYVSKNHSAKGSTGDGQTSTTYGNSLFNQVKTLTVSNITIKNSIIGDSDCINSNAGIFAGQVSGKSTFTNVSIENCTIYGCKKVGLLAGFTHGKIELNNVTVKDNTVISLEGECGVLIGIATYSEADGKPFTVSNLTMSNNIAKFSENSKTFKISNSTVTSNDKTYSTLPLNKEFGYEKNSSTECRVGCAGVCFLGINASYIMQDSNIKDTVNGCSLRMACALNDPSKVTSDFTISSLYSK